MSGWAWLVAFVAVLVVLVAWAYRADQAHCDRLLARARSTTDTLVVVSSRRCAFISIRAEVTP